jgi:calcineurin-like phosphoesterase family protein
MYYFTADQHYGHKRIIEYCKRPFDSVDDMDEYMINEHNKVVKPNDIVINIGDFSLYSRKYEDVAKKYIRRLNGMNVFIPGSHDQWLGNNKNSHIWQKSIEGQQVICCHYAMRTWPASHYGSWHLFGHSHGNLLAYGNSFDVGVDSHEFRPWSFEEVKEKMDLLSF